MTPEESKRLDRIRSRLMRAVRAERPAHLRTVCVELAADIEAMLAGLPVPDEQCPPTVRAAEERDTEPAPPPTDEPSVEVVW